MTEVDKGNVSAIDKVFKRLDRHDQAVPRQMAKPAKAPKLGKKEQAVVDAADPPKSGQWSSLIN
jgi:hypothetical protein